MEGGREEELLKEINALKSHFEGTMGYVASIAQKSKLDGYLAHQMSREMKSIADAIASISYLAFLEERKEKMGLPYSTKMGFFSILPIEIQFHVFAHFDAKDVAILTQVCSTWFQMKEYLWMELLKRDFPNFQNTTFGEYGIGSDFLYHSKSVAVPNIVKEPGFVGHVVCANLARGRCYQEGQWNRLRKLHGYGLCTYDGNRYEGQWNDGLEDGTGICWYADGNTYQGEWKAGKRHGVGIYICLDGEQYSGQWSNGEAHGTGSCWYVGGDKYEGNWANGSENGFGKCWYVGGDIYEGEWKDGKENGEGTCWYISGDKYEGTWKNGEANGYGKYVNSSGDCYQGNWNNGVEHGKGTCWYSSGDEYDGDWYNGCEHGWGTCWYANGSKYTGEWQNGVEHGKGTCWHAGGDKCEGEWKDSNLDGKGTCWYADGTVFSGHWKNGQKHGRALCDYSDGSQFVGQFKNDQKDGDGVCYFPSGDRFVCGWNKGLPYGDGMYLCCIADSQFLELKVSGVWSSSYQGKGKIVFPNGHYFKGSWELTETASWLCLNGSFWLHTETSKTKPKKNKKPQQTKKKKRHKIENGVVDGCASHLHDMAVKYCHDATKRKRRSTITRIQRRPTPHHYPQKTFHHYF